MLSFLPLGTDERIVITPQDPLRCNNPLLPPWEIASLSCSKLTMEGKLSDYPSEEFPRKNVTIEWVSVLFPTSDEWVASCGYRSEKLFQRRILSNSNGNNNLRGLSLIPDEKNNHGINEVNGI